MDNVHSLLKRQLMKCLNSADPQLKDEWAELLKQINDAYHQFDNDRRMLEHSLDLSSQELMEANEDVRAILSAFPDLYFVVNNAGVVLQRSKVNSGDVCFSPRVMIGKSLQDMEPKEIGKLFEEAIWKVERNEAMVKVDFWFSNLSVKKCYEARLLPFRGNKIFIVVRDITESRMAENKLLEQQQILSMIIANVPHHIFWKDKDLNYLGCNPNFAKVGGLKSPDEIIGKNDYDMPWKKEESDFFRKIDREVMEKGEPILDIEEPQLQADGREATLLTSKVPLRDSGGKVFGILGIYADITERKKAEETIKRVAAENLHLAQAVNSVYDGILITDFNKPDNPIIYVNPAFTKITGYTPEEVKGRNCRILQGPATDPATVIKIREAIQNRSEVKVTILNYRKDGRRFWNDLSITPILSHTGELLYFVGIQRDVTERMQIDEELKATNASLLKNERALRNMLFDLNKTHDELKSAQGQLVQSEKLAAIGQLAAGVAHEINNPVGFISSNMEILTDYIKNYTRILTAVEEIKKHIEAEDMAKARSAVGSLKNLETEINLEFMAQDVNKLLEHSSRGLERIRKIVLDLKTFARADHLDSRELVKIEEVIDSILSIVQSELKYKAELIKDYGETPMIRCDLQRLGQVFINLLVNAAQAIEDRGKITIRTYKKDQSVCIEVEDTGKGIAQDNMKKIFEPFFTTKPVGEGTGLGLSVSYEIIKKHSGELRVHSEVGKGTTFTVVLPTG
jgi:PAS domain S-box-containing protein